MHDGFRVYVKLAGQFDHFPPAMMALGGRPPQAGDVIEVPIGSRVVRARVTDTYSPERRGGVNVVHVVFADEIA